MERDITEVGTCSQQNKASPESVLPGRGGGGGRGRNEGMKEGTEINKGVSKNGKYSNRNRVLNGQVVGKVGRQMSQSPVQTVNPIQSLGKFLNGTSNPNKCRPKPNPGRGGAACLGLVQGCLELGNQP